MTKSELNQPREGDLIQSRLTQLLYLVTGNYGDHVTAVQTADVTNADEWILVAKCKYLHVALRAEKEAKR